VICLSIGTGACGRTEIHMKPDALEQMHADARLSLGLRPAALETPASGAVLLTGATGFLGGHLLHQMLQRGFQRVVCLVRDENAHAARERLIASLRKANLLLPGTEARIVVLCGDITAVRLGLTASAYDALAHEVDAVFHCAAEVNWVKSYRQLRRSNVMGTLTLLEFCCAVRAKALTFVSTIAVCFSRGAAAGFDEASDMLPWAGGMPLGYARSKCVAESLLRVASAAGLPVTIIRPGLLAGDTVTGRANASDLVSALITVCVDRGVAPDADWLFDSLPVDYAAQAIIELSLTRRVAFETYHLRHSKPRHWREMVLWLNLLGYPMRLLPTAVWLQRVFAAGENAGALSSYRRFFTATDQASRPFEVYLADGQAAVTCAATRSRLGALGVREPALDTELLRRYVNHFASTGAIPQVAARAGGRVHAGERDAQIKIAVSNAIDSRSRDVPAATLEWEALPFDSGNGVLNEIAAIRMGAEVGIRRYRVHGASSGSGGPLDLLVKAKPNGALMRELIAEVGTIENPSLGRSLREYPAALGLSRSHLREVALYSSGDAALLRHMPKCYGTVAEPARGVWSVAIEHLSAVDRIDDVDGADRWPQAYRDAAIEGAAQIHAAWYGRESALRRQIWLGPEIAATQAQGMSALWRELTAFSAPFFEAWTGHSLMALRMRFIDTLEQWWGELSALPKTLIHNDYNPRNLAFRRTVNGPQVCAFDWELARIGVPQHDVAELLCFTLPEAADLRELERSVELHRTRLSDLTGVRIAPDVWMRGFVLALQQLSIERLPLYALVHRFKPQPFMPRVVRNWMRLYDMSLSLERRPRERRAAAY
jgi:thioester reductase-like protein